MVPCEGLDHPRNEWNCRLSVSGQPSLSSGMALASTQPQQHQHRLPFLLALAVCPSAEEEEEEGLGGKLSIVCGQTLTQTTVVAMTSSVRLFLNFSIGDYRLLSDEVQTSVGRHVSDRSNYSDYDKHTRWVANACQSGRAARSDPSPPPPTPQLHCFDPMTDWLTAACQP